MKHAPAHSHSGGTRLPLLGTLCLLMSTTLLPAALMAAPTKPAAAPTKPAANPAADRTEGAPDGSSGTGNSAASAPGQLKDKSWKFSDATSKEDAMKRAKGDKDFASLSVSDFNTVIKGMTSISGTQGGRGEQKLRSMFRDWAAEYGLSYNNTQEAQTAFQNFAANMAQVQQVNNDPSTPYWASGNQYSSLSFSQFSAQYLMNVNNGVPPTTGADDWVPRMGGGSRRLSQVSAPANVNWVTAGKVTPIKNQGACGSCWAFAATTAIESMYLIKAGGSASTLNLSEQQLVSCVNPGSGPYSGYGCNGGWSDQAINYVAGINQTTESRYAYTARTGACNKVIVATSQSGQAVKLSGKALRVSPTKTESALMTAVAVAPTVFYFAVDGSFQSYAGGIYVARSCSTNINHAMVAVGYSTAVATNRYWIIRNSWSAGWGERGYARVKMTGNGAGPCGMYQYAYLPPSTFIKKLS